MHKDLDTYIKGSLLPDVAEEIAMAMNNNLVDIVPYEPDPEHDVLCGRCCYSGSCGNRGSGIFVIVEAPCTIYEQYGEEKLANDGAIYVFEGLDEANTQKFNTDVFKAIASAEVKAREMLKDIEYIQRLHT